VPHSPLGRGFLTGAITSLDELGRTDARVATVQRVRAIAERKGARTGQLALAWVLAKGEDLVPIPGTKRRI